ncbi:MAG: carbohydrate ABC transporter permease [Alphaproteobacteria bacterium]
MTVATFLFGRRGRRGFDWTDLFAYFYLALGVLLILAPVAWLLVSSFKTQRALTESDPRPLPYEQVTVPSADGARNLSVFEYQDPQGKSMDVAVLVASGAQATVFQLGHPENAFEVSLRDLKPKEVVRLHTENYTEPLDPAQSRTFNFPRYFLNSTVVTVTATLLTLLINSMAAFALSKYRFRGRNFFMAVIIVTLLMPATVILVPLFVVVRNFGMLDSLWGVIIPGAATPTGVFLLRQYMLTLPDELIEAARMDGASEWKIYWRIILPLSLPALAVLAILSIIWRWNDFLWPLIVLTRSEVFTLQIGLSTFKGELNDSVHYLLAMTVLTLLPVTAVFALLQKYITSGIANTGMK